MRTRAHRPGYREAVEWLVYNDDLTDLDHESGPILTVAASLVRDLWQKPDETFVRDLRAAISAREANR